MEDRAESSLGNISAVGARTRIQVIGGKPYLVVDNNVNGASGTVSGQLRHLKQFVYNALPGDGSITMNEDRGKPLVISLVIPVDPGSCYTLYHRVDGFQV